MSSQTYNIVITRDPKVTEKLFYDKFNRTSFTERFGSLSEEEKIDSLIVSPQRNNNFISFDIDFPQAQQQRYAVLKMVESNDLLEYFMVSKSGLEELIKLKAKVIKTFRGNSGLIDKARKVKPSFFISFGMGDDVSQWSGPYVVELIDANLTTTSDGVREAEFMFSPTVEGQFVFTNKVFDDANIAQAGSIFNSNLNLDDKFIITSGKTYGLTDDDIIKKPGDSSGKEGGFNYAVRDLIKLYLSERLNVPKNNVLLLLDDDFKYLDLKKLDFVGYTRGQPNFGKNNLQTLQRYAAELGIQVTRPLDIDVNLDKDLAKKAISGLARRIQTGVGKFLQRKQMEKSVKRMKSFIERQNSELQDLKKKIVSSLFSILRNSLEFNNIGGFQPTLDNAVKERFFINPDGTELTSPSTANLRQGLDKRIQITLAYAKEDSNFKKYYLPVRNKIIAYIEKLQGQVKDLEQDIQVLKQGNAFAERDIPEPPFRIPMKSKGESMIQIGSLRNNSDPELVDNLLMVKAKKAFKSNIEKLISVQSSPKQELFLSVGRSMSSSDTPDTDLNILYPLYKLIEGIGGFRATSKINDFTILEEHNHKILKLLERHNLIETSDSPIVIFGREKIINSVIYPEKLDRMNFDLLTTFWEMKLPSAFLNSPGFNQTVLPLADLNPDGSKYIKSRDLPIVRAQGDASLAEILSRIDAYRQDFMSAFTDMLTPLTSSFKEQPYFGKYDKEASLKIDSLKSPLVFMNNSKNANVLELSFDSSPYKAVLLNVGYQSGYALLDESLDTSSLISDNRLFSPKLTELIKSLSDERVNAKNNQRDFITNLTTKGGDTRKLVLQLVADASTSSIGSLSIASLLDFAILKSSVNPTLKKKSGIGLRDVSYVDTIRNINKYIISVKLKTLPFFNATTVMGRDCYLFGLSNNIIGSNNLRDIEAPAFYTGSYTIIGYKHKISYDGAHSEFDLVPNSLGLGTISNDINVIEFFNITKDEIDDVILEAKEREQQEDRRDQDRLMEGYDSYSDVNR